MNCNRWGYQSAAKAQCKDLARNVSGMRRPAHTLRTAAARAPRCAARLWAPAVQAGDLVPTREVGGQAPPGCAQGARRPDLNVRLGALHEDLPCDAHEPLEEHAVPLGLVHLDVGRYHTDGADVLLPGASRVSVTRRRASAERGGASMQTKARNTARVDIAARSCQC